MTVPHYVNENKSDIWSIKPGWYAMEDDGDFTAGPFSSREECVSRTAQTTDASTPQPGTHFQAMSERIKRLTALAHKGATVTAAPLKTRLTRVFSKLAPSPGKNR